MPLYNKALRLPIYILEDQVIWPKSATFVNMTYFLPKLDRSILYLR